MVIWGLVGLLVSLAEMENQAQLVQLEKVDLKDPWDLQVKLVIKDGKGKVDKVESQVNKEVLVLMDKLEPKV
jgi:hypothetical protein